MNIRLIYVLIIAYICQSSQLNIIPPINILKYIVHLGSVCACGYGEKAAESNQLQLSRLPHLPHQGAHQQVQQHQKVKNNRNNSRHVISLITNQMRLYMCYFRPMKRCATWHYFNFVTWLSHFFQNLQLMYTRYIQLMSCEQMSSFFSNF